MAGSGAQAETEASQAPTANGGGDAAKSRAKMALGGDDAPCSMDGGRQQLSLNGRPVGLRRQATRYPHGLGVSLVQTPDDRATAQPKPPKSQSRQKPQQSPQPRPQSLQDRFGQAATMRSHWGEGARPPCQTDANSHRKYKISMVSGAGGGGGHCGPESMAELQVRRYKYPLTGNYYLDAQEPTKASLALLEYTKRYCQWRYVRWPLIFLASVLLFFGLITYCIWLHDVSVARDQFQRRKAQLQQQEEQEQAAADAGEDDVGVPASTVEVRLPPSTTPRSHRLQESTILRAIGGHRSRQRPSEQRLTTLEYAVSKGAVDWAMKGRKEGATRGTTATPPAAEATTLTADEAVLAPETVVRFTSGHQNSFGIPIEEDERLLRIINRLFPSNQPTVAPSTTARVSPTIPPVRASRPTTAMGPARTTQAESGCVSTQLPMCRGVLEYDLTKDANADLSEPELEAYQLLIRSNCSARAVEFVCAALEPECRPSHIGQLPPCRRICKAILEACSIVIASSDTLTSTFDCSLYPDSNDPHKCEDPTRRRGYCFDNEFECYDRSCIPHQWQCDNIKDCAAGEDEESCIVCDSADEFRCRSNEKCVPEAVRCDATFDCFDGSDEEDCDEYGSGEAAAFDEAALNSFPRIFSYASFLSPNQSSEKLYTYITATTDDESGTKFQVHEVTNQTHGISTEEVTNTVPGDGPKGFVNFRDSKEIMMTSDSENKFKYSSARGNRSAAQPGSANTTPLSPAASLRVGVTTEAPVPGALAKNASCAPHQLRCVTGHCITVEQLCDKKMDCPDGADELMCVYKERSTSSSSGSSSTTSSSLPRPKQATPMARADPTSRTIRTTVKRKVKT